MDYLNLLTFNGIWSIEQNKPSLIADDLEQHDIPRHLAYSIMLGRGVFKWFAVRRDLIKLKDAWRDKLTALYCLTSKNEVKKGTKEYYKNQGRIEMLEECRADVRALCHSERFRAPDFDDGANKFLSELINASG